MRTKKFFIALMAIASLAACQEQEEVIKPNDPTRYDLTATIEAVEDLTWSWEAEDAITVYDGKAVNAFVTSEGGESAVFSGLANKNADELMAIYPSTTQGRHSGKVDMVLPVAQAGVKGGVAKSNIILAAYKKNDGQNVLNFTNMVSFAKFNIREDLDVVAVELRSNAGEPLAGKVKVGLFEEPTIEPAEGASVAVTLSDDPCAGTYYVAVIPQTLTQGYTLNLVASDDSRASVTVSEEVVFERGKITELTADFTNVDWVAPVNPNPTTVPSVKIVKASFAEAEFNLVGEGDFDEYPEEALGYRTPWEIAHHDQGNDAGIGTGPDGSKCLEYNLPKAGWHQIHQGVSIKPSTGYIYTVDAKSDHDSKLNSAYNGVVVHPGGLRHELNGNEWRTATWKTLTKEFTSAPGHYYGEVFLGTWWEPTIVIQYDNVKLIPKGYEFMSMKPTTHEVLGDITNATFDEVTDLGKVVAWKNEEGKICMILSNFVVNGVAYDTGVAFTKSTDLTAGVSISKFTKSGGKISPIKTPDGELIKSIIPNDVFVFNGKTYLHYYAKTGDDPANVNNWFIDHAGFLVSEDGGKTWTEAEGKWRGDGRFVQAAFAQKDDYIYVVASGAGREPGSIWANMYIARVSTSVDITEPTNWDYYNGTEWIAGDETIAMNPAVCLTVGARGEPELVYNEKFGRFMMIYRDDRQEGLVYRDAETMDGFWSAQKCMVSYDNVPSAYCPSVLDQTANGDLLMVVPQL